MKNISSAIKRDLRKFSDRDKAKLLAGFFKTGKGEYGEGDKFLGVMVPQTRGVARKYFSTCSLGDVEEILDSPFHEDRLAGLIILVHKFERSDDNGKNKIFRFYLTHASRINNWDLVDLSAKQIVGEWLFDKDEKTRNIIFKLARSKNIWERRIAVLATFYFIGKNEVGPSLVLAEKLLTDDEDLMHKAVGWMLREAGKKDEGKLVIFLERNMRSMPRTMLRYAIEKFGEKRRKEILMRSKI